LLDRRSQPETKMGSNDRDRTSDQTMESIMLAIILNAIYRQFLRTSLSGARIAGA
jgi:hypothetical protein